MNCILGESKANGRNKGGGRVCYCELTKVSKEVQSLPASKAIVAAAEYKNAIHSWPNPLKIPSLYLFAKALLFNLV